MKANHSAARLFPVLVALLLASSLALAKTYRDPAQRRAFMQSHPCPSTGKTKGRCPGYVVDHIKPLCAGGPDRPSNMQWQTVEASKDKDRIEREQCKQR
jgi:hypothetical protein